MRPGGPERAPCSAAAEPSPPQGSQAHARPSAAASCRASVDLPTPGAPHQGQHWGRDVRVRQAHGDVVDEALLDRAVRRMPRVEDRPRARQIERRAGAHGPGQAHQTSQVLAGAGVLGIAGRPRRHLLDDLPPPDPHGRRQDRRVELAAQAIEPVGVAFVRLAEEPAELPGGDAVADEGGVAGLQPERHLAADRVQTAGELADPPLAGVVADDPPAGACGEPDRCGRQSGRPVLRIDQVRLGDGDLLGLGIAGQVDELEPVAQGRRDPGRLVRRGDEQHLGQVERQLDERVAEAVVLRRVEHFEQDGGRVGAELVDLVEHEDRDADVAAAERAGDGHGQRPLPGPRLSGQAEDGSRGIGWSRAHGQRARVGLGSPAAARAFDGEQAAGLRARRQHLEEARLDRLETAVGAVERLLEMLRVEPLRLARVPRQGEDRLGPVQRLVDRLSLGCERLPNVPPQRLPHEARQAGSVQSGEHLVESRAGCDERADGIERRTAGAAVPPWRRGVGGGTGRRAVCGLGQAGSVDKQAERLGGVHDTRPPGRRQVGQVPAGPLLGGGDHAATACRSARRLADAGAAVAGRAGRTANGVERLSVFVDRRGIDEQHGGVFVSPELLHAHPVHPFHGRLALSVTGPGRSPGHRGRQCGL